MVESPGFSRGRSQLKEHLHPKRDEEDLVCQGAEGVARLLVRIARSAEPGSPKRARIESLLRRWAEENPRDRTLLERLADLDTSSQQ